MVTRSPKALTIRDIARLSGVSIATVSRVVNDAGGVGAATTQRVRKIIEHHDFHPNGVAQSLSTKRTHTIGLVIPDVRNPFFSELARGVEDTCNANSFGCLLCNTDGSVQKENDYVQVLRGRVADGAIFTTQNDTEFNRSFLPLQRRGYPFVFIERYVPEMPDVPGVYFDNVTGARELTDFIVARGHRKIAFISGPLSTSNARLRKQGFVESLARGGLPLEERLIVEGNYRYSGGYKAAEELLDRGGQFTALLAANDLMALGAYQLLQDRGLRVPEDVSVAGFDDITYPPVLRPLVTTVEIPAYALGKSAAEMLFDVISGRPLASRRRIFPPTLKDKGSVAPPAVRRRRARRRSREREGA